MARTIRNRSDDEDADILKDGQVGRVRFRDAQSVRTHAQLHDGRGGVPGRRPGYAFDANPYVKDELAIAYAERDEYLRDGWKGTKDAEGFREGSEGDSCTI